MDEVNELMLAAGELQRLGYGRHADNVAWSVDEIKRLRSIEEAARLAETVHGPGAPGTPMRLLSMRLGVSSSPSSSDGTP